MDKTILCIGAGYVGAPTMAVLADNCPEYRVIVVDINEQRIAAWNSDKLPIYEPGLDEVVKRNRNKNLFFSTDVQGGIKKAGIIFVSVNTPTKTSGRGAGKAANLQYWEQTARDIIEHSENDKIVIEKSTLPVRTAEAMHRILSANDKGLNFDIISNPEFMAEGTAVDDLQSPDRVLIGAMEDESGQRALRRIVAIYQHWIADNKIKTTNVWSSELSKLVANAMLAQRVSSINSISALCEKTDANILDVSDAIGMDSRIGAKFIKAGIGFGGSCFKKDILNLVYLCEYYGLPEVAAYWEQVVKINDYQGRRFVDNIVNRMFNNIAGKKIAVFGFAFKADTGDTRESPAITICKLLLEENAQLAIHDPQALHNAKLDLADSSGEISYCENPAEAATDAHAIVILTEWQQFKDYDYRQFYRAMKKPAFIFDGRNILDHQALYELGYNVFPLGQKARNHLDCHSY
ncbi:MAG: nucleotide sugar dehydrogenase [Victivallaceae bacterium]|nr:nucleotide sugar dehydrogenase [Victivallaceae bacterium]